MKRVLRFRAWDNNTDEMIKGDSFSIEAHGIVWQQKSYGTSTRDGVDLEIMQFTRLLDESGVEIYEGDILVWFLRDRKKIAEVEFDVKYGHWIAKDKRLNYYVEAIDFPLCEVIGNIFEDKELLGV